MQNTLSGLFRFLDEGISPFHAVRAAEQRLQDALNTLLPQYTA